MAPLRDPFSFAVFYAAIFAVLGVFLPFWPLWLETRGISAGEIGILLAVASWARVATSPLLAQLADRSGRQRLVLSLCALCALASFALFPALSGFASLLLAQCLAMIFFSPLVPLSDSLALAAQRRGTLDYGRVRLWGSLAFIAAGVGAGELVSFRGLALIPALVIGGAAASLVASLLLPDQGRGRSEAAERGAFRSLITRRSFQIFLLAAALLQASHAAYYGFSSIHWKANGLTAASIGWLWAEGVIAEVLLFSLGARLVVRLRPTGLLLLAGSAGILRWSVLGLSSDLAWLIPAQCLHALTFAAAHLGAMHLISGTAPVGLSATAQAVYAALTGGVALSLALLLAGFLFEREPSSAFFAMAALSLLGTLAAIALTRQPDQRVP